MIIKQFKSKFISSKKSIYFRFDGFVSAMGESKLELELEFLHFSLLLAVSMGAVDDECQGQEGSDQIKSENSILSQVIFA